MTNHETEPNMMLQPDPPPTPNHPERNEVKSKDRQYRIDWPDDVIIPPIRPRSSMDRAPDFESVGWEFESLRGRLSAGYL